MTENDLYENKTNSDIWVKGIYRMGEEKEEKGEDEKESEEVGADIVGKTMLSENLSLYT